MAINQQCLPALNTQDREGSDRDQSRASPPPRQSLRKELVTLVLQELALFQFLIILTDLFLQGIYVSSPKIVYVVIQNVIIGIMVWIILILHVLRGLGLSFLGLGFYVYNAVPTYPTSLVITTGMILLLIVLDGKLISATDISKKSAALSEKDGKKIKKMKIYIRWLGHLLLIVLAGIYIFKLFHIHNSEDVMLHKYFYICCVFLTSGTFFKVFIDFITLEPDKKIMLAVQNMQWIPLKQAIEKIAMKWFALKHIVAECINFIPLKWIVMLEFAYSPLAVIIVVHFLLSGEVYKDFSLTIPLAKAVILTMCTSSYEELRLQRGAKNMILGAAQVVLVGVLLHYVSIGSDYTDLVICGLEGIAMWAVHFSMSKLYH